MAFPVSRHRRLWAGLLLGFTVFISVGAEVPPTLASTILARALAYDRTLTSRAGPAVVVAVVRPPADPRCDGMLQGFRELEKVTLAGLPFRAMEVPFTSVASLENLRSAGVDALFLCPGLESSLPLITAYSRGSKVLTLTSTQAYVQNGVSLGAVMEAGKPRLWVNLEASKLEGAQFSSDMMKLAKVIR